MSRPPVTPPAPGEPHKNLTSLAAELGFSVPAFSAWRKRYTDTPETLHADAWRAWIASKGLGRSTGAGHGRPADKDYEALRNEKTETEIRLNKIKIAKEERQLIPADEVSEFLKYAASKTKSALFQMVAETAPKCAGLEAGEIRGVMRTAADTICLSMQTTLEDWQAEQEEARRAAEQATGHNQQA
jgi:hypothetical protein